MAMYIISYDLIEDKDYNELISELEERGATRVLSSVWFLSDNNTSCTRLLDQLSGYIDDDDHMFVVRATDMEGINLVNSPISPVV